MMKSVYHKCDLIWLLVIRMCLRQAVVCITYVLLLFFSEQIWVYSVIATAVKSVNCFQVRDFARNSSIHNSTHDSLGDLTQSGGGKWWLERRVDHVTLTFPNIPSPRPPPPLSPSMFSCFSTELRCALTPSFLVFSRSWYEWVRYRKAHEWQKKLEKESAEVCYYCLNVCYCCQIDIHPLTPNAAL